MPLSDEIRSCGGLAATHELLDRGYTQRTLGYATATGHIIRVRQGWYCLPDTDIALQEAVRVGGRLSCVSGAEHHSLWVRRTTKLHVDVIPTASRLRSRTDKRIRLATLDSPMTVVHWDDAHSPGTRFALSARECLRRMTACRPPEEVIAAVDSALRLGLISPQEWADDIRPLSPRLRRLLARVDARSESIIESITRFRLNYAGYEPHVQVKVPGVGRVDLVFGTRLVIELDGWEYHADRERFEADRRRDARLSARGYRVLRFSYRQVMDSWSEVRAAIVAAVARGDHLP
ncbi:very-short-patch-repair endonuclease [Cryobacterium mesophilum]|uniref:DUF559 domain-containing protein n=1 Tax=Terrimesophilobacter mesophilus TaxID=433647 RepID=A0A4R8VCF8_9MICO|nr:DUF559 domain-containing protein [Terrimesophilobacter mesophilus]MBB5633834.1 very-short-patch-repair endonuclease [Terrimesophilobacter mesophilus]TFB80513.1 DUF559 domain-containing protein [Terrimesophilobacter mesophilus]